MKLKKLLFPIDQENIFKALMYTMLLAATLHLVVCLYKAILYGDPDYINMFNIIGISLVFPALGTGALNCLLGIISVIAIGVWFYAMQQSHDRHPNSRRRKQ